MRPARSLGGFQLPSVRSVAAKLALALLAGSVAFQLGLVQLALRPDLVVERLYLWQPVSYAFVAPDLLGLIFGVLITYQLGGALEVSWGSRRLLIFALGTTAVAGVLTVLAGGTPDRVPVVPQGFLFSIQHAGF